MTSNDNHVKTALVTGGERGIGGGIVIRLLREGYDVAFTYFFDKENTEDIVAEADRLRRKCVFFQSDFRKSSETEQVIPKAVSLLGKLDLVVNNAAIMPPRLYQYEYSAKDIDEVVAVNYRGYMLIMRDAIRYWIKTNTIGSIINISSESAISSHQKFSLYGGIKSAIVRSSCNAALDVAPYNIRINCILPGCIDTYTSSKMKDPCVTKEDVQKRDHFAREMIPLRRQGTPLEIGNAVCWLASDEADYITGAVLPVDGGLTLPGLTDMSPNPDEIVYGMCTKQIINEEITRNW